MAGFVDLSSYAQTADFGGLTTAEVEEILATI